MTTSNEVRDSILDVDDVQTSLNIYDDDNDSQSWSIITPYLDSNHSKSRQQKVPFLDESGFCESSPLLF